MNRSAENVDLNQALYAALVEPYASHYWESSRGKSFWTDLEPIQDSIAGPLYSIAKRGGCEHVYARNDRYFAGVDDPDSLRRRVLEWHSELAAAVEQFVPASDAESADHSYMRSQAVRIRELIHQAVKVEEQRWQISHKAPG
jgi:hypothetical protein